MNKGILFTAVPVAILLAMFTPMLSAQRASYDCCTEQDAEMFAVEAANGYGQNELAGEILTGGIDVYFGTPPPGSGGQSWTNPDGTRVIVLPGVEGPERCGGVLIHEGEHLLGENDPDVCAEEYRVKQKTADTIIDTAQSGVLLSCEEKDRMTDDVANGELACCCNGEGPINPVPLGPFWAEMPCEM